MYSCNCADGGLLRRQGRRGTNATDEKNPRKSLNLQGLILASPGGTHAIPVADYHRLKPQQVGFVPGNFTQVVRVDAEHVLDTALTGDGVDFDSADELLHKVFQPLSPAITYLSSSFSKYALNLTIGDPCQRSCGCKLGLATADILL
jgi:hypothetical protein